MKQRFFMTSTGTGIGKSFITTACVRQARAAGRSVIAYKPVISGFDPAQVAETDTGLILQSLDMPLTPENIARVSPWRFKEPLAPSMAARMEDRSIDFEELVDQSRVWIDGPEDIVLIEGLGGVMVPLDDRHTVIDWIKPLNIATLLIVGSYLGTISHTLTALDALQQRNIPLHAIIVNETERSSVSLPSTVDEIRRWTKIPIISVAHYVSGNTSTVHELSGLLR